MLTDKLTISGPSHWGLTLSKVADRGRPPMWRVANNTLNKQLRTADRWLSSNLGVGRNPHSKIGIVTKHEL